MEINFAGIYKITNIINNKIYIGSTNCLLRRKKEHFRHLKSNYHYNRKLQNAFNKYGIENFKFEILEEVVIQDDETLCDFLIRLVQDREQHYLDTLLLAAKNSHDFFKLGYNSCRKAGSFEGYKFTKQQRKKLSKAFKGRIPWNKGLKNPYSEEVNRKRAEKGKGKVAWNKGKSYRLNPEAEKRRIEALRKRGPWNKNLKLGKQSKELVQKRVEARRGYKHSDEIKKRMSSTHLNRLDLRRKTVYQFDLSGKLVRTYKSTNECMRDNNYHNIPRLCTTNGKCYGFYWSYNKNFKIE